VNLTLYLRSIPGMCLFVVAVNYTLLQCGASDLTLNAVALGLGVLHGLLTREEPT